MVGTSSYLYYIKDGYRQQNAIRFTASIPHQVDLLSFGYYDPEKVRNRISNSFIAYLLIFNKQFV